MPTVALQVTIGDYAKWRPIFDKYRSHRAEAGFKNERVYRNVDDPSEVIIWEKRQAGPSCEERSQVQNLRPP